MSNLKVNEELFLGEQEINRLLKFLVDDGYKLWFSNNVEQYGIVDRVNQDAPFNNFKLIQGGTAADLTLKAGLAIDSNLDFIYANEDAIDVVSVPTDNVFRDITIKYNTTNIEKGTVEISSTGQITGTGTLFTEVLRGKPNFNSLIKFPNSTVNTGEYEVVTVTNDTDALLTGAITAEVGAEYEVVGTFTPTIAIPVPNKQIFVYDSYTITVGGTPTVGTEFLLAKVKSDGAVMVIEDVRGEIFKTKADFNLTDFDRAVNPLAGLDFERYDTIHSDRSENTLRVGFGMIAKTSGYTLNPSAKQIIISEAKGGAYKATVNFSDGEFNGWRVYFKSTGQYAIIEASTRVGTVITLVLRSYDVDRLPVTVDDDITIVPNCDRVEIITSAVNIGTGFFDTSVFEKSVTVPVMAGFVDLKQKVSTAPAPTTIAISYRNIFGKESSFVSPINESVYFIPAAFDDEGTFILNTTDTVAAGGIIVLTNINPNNHEARLAAIEGDANYARRDEENTFTEMQHLTAGADIDVKGLDVINLLTDGNQFEIFDFNTQLFWMTTKAIGTRVTLTAREVASISHRVVAGRPLGFSPFLLNELNTQEGTMNLSTENGYTFEVVPFSTYGAWSYVGIKGAELQRIVENAWIDIPVVLADVESNSAFGGGGTPQGALALDEAGSHFKYRKVGKTADISVHLKGIQLNNYNANIASSVTVKIPTALQSVLAPLHIISAPSIGIPLNADMVVGQQNAHLDSSIPNVLSFHIRDDRGDGISWARKYDFAAAGSRVLVGTGDTAFFPNWTVKALFTYETA